MQNFTLVPKVTGAYFSHHTVISGGRYFLGFSEVKKLAPTYICITKETAKGNCIIV